MIDRFGRKASGFISQKSEVSLEELGILTPASKFSTRLAGEFLVRYFAKTSTALSRILSRVTHNPFLNFSMDGSRVCKVQAVFCSVVLGFPLNINFSPRPPKADIPRMELFQNGA